jgi:hypothetical protein
MIGTDPGRAFMEKRDAMAIMAARPFLRKKGILENHDPNKFWSAQFFFESTYFISTSL